MVAQDIDPADILATLREGLLVLTEDLAIEYASAPFLHMFGLSHDEVVGGQVSDLADGILDTPAFMEPLERVVDNSVPSEAMELTIDLPASGARVMSISARQIIRQDGGSRALLVAFHDVTFERELEADRERALEASNKLLFELNHRVMNSLGMINALIGLEVRKAPAEAHTALERVKTRIGSVASLYRLLSHSKSVETVSTDSYLTAVADELITTGRQSTGTEIDLVVDVDAIDISTETAVPLGLVVNELVTNSFKYAFNGRDKGALAITLKRERERMLLTISDDGPGIDPDARVDSGLGQRLTKSFVNQLRAEMTTSSSATGVQHSLSIPVGHA